MNNNSLSFHFSMILQCKCLWKYLCELVEVVCGRWSTIPIFSDPLPCFDCDIGKISVGLNLSNLSLDFLPTMCRNQKEINKAPFSLALVYLFLSVIVAHSYNQNLFVWSYSLILFSNEMFLLQKKVNRKRLISVLSRENVSFRSNLCSSILKLSLKQMALSFLM